MLMKRWKGRLKTAPSSLLPKAVDPALARARLGGAAAPAAGSLNCPSLAWKAVVKAVGGAITTGGTGGGRGGALTSIFPMSVLPPPTLLRMAEAQVGPP